MFDDSKSWKFDLNGRLQETMAAILSWFTQWNCDGLSKLGLFPWISFAIIILKRLLTQASGQVFLSLLRTLSTPIKWFSAKRQTWYWYQNGSKSFNVFFRATWKVLEILGPWIFNRGWGEDSVTLNLTNNCLGSWNKVQSWSDEIKMWGTAWSSRSLCYSWQIKGTTYMWLIKVVVNYGNCSTENVT